MRKPSYGKPRTTAPLHTLSRKLPPLSLPRVSPPRPPKSAPASPKGIKSATPPKKNP